MQQQPVWIWSVQQRIEYDSETERIGSTHVDDSVLWTYPDVGGDDLFMGLHAI